MRRASTNATSTPRLSPPFRAGAIALHSIGVLTHALAARCDRLLGVDCSEAPLALAEARCRDARNVYLARMSVPADWPAGRFDLVLLSEVLYYLSRREVAAVARQTVRSLRPKGILVLVNFLGTNGASQTGDAAALQFLRETRPFLRPLTRKRNSFYRLDVLAR
jgi:2-polyprenyl-3-methyl-5-hydroxy-6-metoxy-1,4-benzoquinol methylase